MFDDFGFPFSLSQQTETGGGQDVPFSKNKPVRHLLQVCGLLQGSCLAPKEAAFGETSPTTVVVEILHVIYMAGPLQEKLLVFGKTQLTWPTPKRCRSTEPPKCNKAEEHRNSTITGNILTNYAYELHEITFAYVRSLFWGIAWQPHSASGLLIVLNHHVFHRGWCCVPWLHTPTMSVFLLDAIVTLVESKLVRL